MRGFSRGSRVEFVVETIEGFREGCHRRVSCGNY